MGYTGSALAALDSGLPRRSHIFVSSIPDLYQLWAIYHTRSTAQFVWDVADICQSLLAPDRTDEQRNQVRERNIAFTSAAAGVREVLPCKFYGNAVFGYQFTPNDVSTLDYFHPSLRGQAALADITWAASWWR